MHTPATFIAGIITPPDFINGEGEYITRLLNSGAADYVGIRKPGAADSRLAALLESIPRALRGQLRLHDAFHLGAQFGIRAYHLNSRNPHAPAGAASVSRSCHTPEEYDPRCDFVTLSPVFPSISKPGYAAQFDLHKLQPLLAGKRIVALGGVTPARFAILRDTGFMGAAMLGYIWRGITHDALEGRIAAILAAKGKLNEFNS